MKKTILYLVSALLIGFIFGRFTTRFSKELNPTVPIHRNVAQSPSPDFGKNQIRVIDHYPLAIHLSQFDRSIAEELFLRNDNYLKRDLFAELVTRDATAAIEHLETIPEEEQMELYHILAEKWSDSNATEAFEWFSNHADSFERNEYFILMENILYPLAIESPDLANSFITKSEYPDSTREQLLPALAEGWGKQSSEAAFKWLEELSHTNVSPRLFRDSYISIMRQQIEKNPLTSAHAISQLESPLLQEQLVRNVAQPLASSNLNEALEWIEGLANDKIKQVALGSILETSDQNSTNTILDHAIASNFDQESIETLFLQATDQNPTEAASRLNDVPPSTRPSAARAIATNWFSNSPEAATNWINQLPQGPIFDAAATSIARLSYHDDPIQALNWAHKVSDSETREELLTQITTGSSENHLNDLHEHFQSNADPETRKLIGPILNKRLIEAYSDLVLPQ